VKILMLHDEGERLATAPASARLSDQPTQKRHIRRGAEQLEFMPLPEIWLDRVSLGFPKANSW
jgi:hypothetical protein